MTKQCTTYREQFSEYIDGLLGTSLRSQLEQHLAACADCRKEYQSFQQMLEILRRIEPPKVPDLLPVIHERLRKRSGWQILAKRFREPWPQSLPLHGLALATASVLLVLAIGIPSVVKQGVKRDVSVRYVGTQTSLSKPGPRVSGEGQSEQREGSLSLHAAKEKQRSSLDAGSVDSIESSAEINKPNAVADAPTSSFRSFNENEKEAAVGDRLSTLGKDAQGKEEAETKLAQGRLEARDDFDISQGSGVGGMGFESKVEEGFQTGSRREKDEQSVGLKREMAFEETTPKLLGNVTAGLVDDKNQQEQKRIQPAEIPTLSGKSTSSDADNVSINDREYSKGLSPSLQVQWQVEDLKKASVQVKDWVLAKQGFVKVTDERHLEIQLSDSELPVFLQQFSNRSEAVSRNANAEVLLDKAQRNLKDTQAPILSPPSLRSAPIPAAGPTAPQPRVVTIFLELVQD